jgi:RND family efflux transporter MFP subunit
MLRVSFCLLLSLCLAARCLGCRQQAAHEDGAGEALVRVTPITPVHKTLIRRTEQPGQIQAMEQAPIHAKVSGYVAKVQVDIGDRVQGPVYDGEGNLEKPGQELLVIDAPELKKELLQKQAAVEQAKAEVKQARAAVQVAEAMRDSADALVAEAEATRTRTQAEYVRWQSELQRFTSLAAQKAVTDKLVDETRSKFQAAEAARKETTAKIDSAKAQRSESAAQVTKAEADFEAAQAKQAVAEADEQRVRVLNEYCVLRAPFDGVVAARRVDTGHLIRESGAKEPLLEVVRADTVRIFVDVPEVDAGLIAAEAEAVIRIPAQRGEPLKAQVTRSSWVLNTSTRTLRVEIDLPNAEGRLRPGMYVVADLKVAERPDALVIPKSAVLPGPAPACWRIDDSDQLVRQPIQLGLESGGEVEVVSGLSGEERLIGVNVGAFREGQQVEAVSAAVK